MAQYKAKAAPLAGKIDTSWSKTSGVIGNLGLVLVTGFQSLGASQHPRQQLPLIPDAHIPALHPESNVTLSGGSVLTYTKRNGRRRQPPNTPPSQQVPTTSLASPPAATLEPHTTLPYDTAPMSTLQGHVWHSSRPQHAALTWAQ